MNTTDIGMHGESVAAKFLKKHGFRILEKNLHVSHNELDIIAKNKEYIIFVEVKTRSSDQTLNTGFGSPASAVDKSKQSRTVTAARGYLKNSKYTNLQPRFDVIEVYLDKNTQKVLKINHIINAFGA